MHVATHNIDAGELLLQSRSKVQSKVQEEINKEVEEMLEMGIIRPLRSPWESPVDIVPKPDRTIRLCVHYRKLPVGVGLMFWQKEN